jgi:DNA-binding transcriptional MerR regulator
MTTRELMAATGVTERQVQWWAETGLLRCHLRGARREFDPSEAILARVGLRLVHFPSARRRVIATLRKRPQRPPFFIVTDVHGRHIRFARTTGELVKVALNAQEGIVIAEMSAANTEVGLPTSGHLQMSAANTEVKP